jgi:hypothetical protein
VEAYANAGIIPYFPALEQMTLADLNHIETACDLKLPEAYREWALKLPPAGENLKHWHYLFDDPEIIIDDNLSLHRADAEDSWPRFLFCVGGADGNYQFINLNDCVATDGGAFPVYYYDHEECPWIDSSNWQDFLIKEPVPFWD